MLQEPSISIRKSIRWAEADAYEDTSEKRFVDVRIFLAGGDFPQNRFRAEGENRLEWGFAGTAKGTKAIFEDGKLVKPAHSMWTHWVDNKSLDIITDEGYMYDQENGDVLELGSMPHPETKIVTKYEEIWKDIDMESTGTDDKRFSAVLRYDTGPTDRGMVIRIGQFVQGVRRRSFDGVTTTSVVRWQWIDNAWSRILIIGEHDMPCSALFSGGEKSHELFSDLARAVGKSVTGADKTKWECIEANAW